MKTYAIEKCGFHSMERMRDHATSMNVQETGIFKLRDLSVTEFGFLRTATGQEFQLSDVAWSDILTYGGMSRQVADRYASDGLDSAICNAVNTFLTSSKYSCDAVKIITAHLPYSAGCRVALGVPSSSYALVTNERALGCIYNMPRKDTFELKRAYIADNRMELVFVDRSLGAIIDPTGNTVNVGVLFSNSEGTRTYQFSASCFTFRFICSNGMIVGKKNVFSLSAIHRGQMNLDRVVANAPYMLPQFHDTMQALPFLDKVPTQKLLPVVKPVLMETVKKERTESFMELMKDSSAFHLWNETTALAHSVKSTDAKVRIESVAFEIFDKAVNMI